MKTIITVLFLTGLLIAAPLNAGPINFRIDINHSNIGFAVPISGGLSKVYGKFSKFKMELETDPDDLTKSSVEVAIDASSIDTGIDQRDEHLRTADFFDVKNHPEITFKSKKITKDGNKLSVTGDFTMRGVTKEITFPFFVTGKQVSDDGKFLTMGFEGNLKIDRTQYNVNWQHPTAPGFVGNVVEIQLNIATRSFRLKK